MECKCLVGKKVEESEIKFRLVLCGFFFFKGVDLGAAASASSLPD